MMRCAYREISGSCVTTTILIPFSRFKRWKMAMISTLVRESRAPVGSSAKMICGSWIRLLAPGKLIGMMTGSIGQTNGLENVHSAPVLLGNCAAAVKQRQFYVLNGAGSGQQVELLEYETDFTVADLRQVIAIQFAHRAALLPCGRRAGMSWSGSRCGSIRRP